MYLYYLIGLFWFLRTSKVFLFYFYLWQLKQYQVWRFLDHFRTAKGRKLLIDKILILKILIFLVFLILLPYGRFLGRELFLGAIFLFILFLYFIESLFFVAKTLKKEIKLLVFTKKIIFLVFTGCAIGFFIFLIISIKALDIYYFTFYLLVFDILVPIGVSLVVLLFEPITMILKAIIMKKAKEKRASHKNLVAVGITGSYGKTTTKEFLSEILSSNLNVLKTKEHQNNEMGISKTILDELKNKHDVFVAEMGAYKKGEIKCFSDIVKPQIAIITGVNEQHLALFGSMENLLSGEGGRELANSLEPGSLLIFNADNKYCLDLYYNFNKQGVEKKLYSANISKICQENPLIKGKIDLWAEDILVEKDFVSFVAKTKEKKRSKFKVSVVGSHNISNLLASILVAQYFGMKLTDISKAAKKIKLNQSPAKIIKTEKEIVILDATYSANPDGVMADLEYLKNYSGKKIIVMPCLIELGAESENIHKQIGKRIGEVCDLAIITTKDYFDIVKKTAIESGMEKENIIFSEDWKEIIRRIKMSCLPGDVILLEGHIPGNIKEELCK